MCSIWRLTSLQKKLPLMKCKSHPWHSNEKCLFPDWVKPRQIMTIVKCPRFYPFPSCRPMNLVSGDSIASWEYLLLIMRMPSRCLSSVQSLEKDGLLWTSPSQQQLIRDNKELGREAGRVGLKPASTFSLLKDDTLSKAASSRRFQSMQWHSYINLTWMGTFLCWNSTLIQTTQVPSITSHCPCYCLQRTSSNNINHLWYSKICQFDIHIPAFAISGVCTGIIRIFAQFRSLCVILFWCK